MTGEDPEEHEGPRTDQFTSNVSGATDAEAFLIDPFDIIINRTISGDVGSTAVVYHANFKADGRELAVKQMREKEADEVAIHRELSVLTNVDHPNIVKLYGIVVDQNPVQICLEYCGGGTLFELLHIRYTVPVSWRQRLVMLIDAAAAMNYLHSFDPKIVHRDLKSLNILLARQVRRESDQPHIKVCDFGFSRTFEAGQSMTRGAGTLQWMAPEVFSRTDYTEAADIFSFAVVCFEVVCRRVPSLQGVARDQYPLAIRQGHRPDITDERMVPAKVPVGLIELIVTCWRQDPEARPSFSEIGKELGKVVASTPDDIKLWVPPTGVQSI